MLSSFNPWHCDDYCAGFSAQLAARVTIYCLLLGALVRYANIKPNSTGKVTWEDTLVFYGGIGLTSTIAISYSEAIGRSSSGIFDFSELSRLGVIVILAYYVLWQEFVATPNKTDDEQMANIIARGLAMANEQKKAQ